jgi:uncharacterized protein
MLIAAACTAFCLLSSCAPRELEQEKRPGLSGDWVGYLEDSGGAMLLTVIRVEKGEKAPYRVSVLSPMQTANAFPGKLYAASRATIKFSFKELKASFVAKLDPAGRAMSGTWTQRGKKLPLEALKADAPFVFSRPQEPKPPFDYMTEELEFANTAAGINLSGTLSYPKGGKAKAGIVLITGSGAQNRDEEIYGHKPFLLLADRLTRSGYAVLRYDDRGTGKSSGDFSRATSFDLLADARAALAELRARKEIKTASFGLIGHSEGGLIAALMAGDPSLISKDAADTKIDFAVMLAGPAFPGDQLLLQQSESILKSQGQGGLALAAAKKANEKIYGIVKSKPLGPEMRKELKRSLLAVGIFGKNAEDQMKAIMTPWFKAFLEIDPWPSLVSARVPVLALYAGRDIQVPVPANSDKMRQGLAASGKASSKVVVLEGLNHLFQKAEKGTLAEYGTIGETMNESVFKTLIPWLDSVSGKK